MGQATRNEIINQIMDRLCSGCEYCRTYGPWEGPDPCAQECMDCRDWASFEKELDKMSIQELKRRFGI